MPTPQSASASANGPIVTASTSRERANEGFETSEAKRTEFLERPDEGSQGKQLLRKRDDDDGMYYVSALRSLTLINASVNETSSDGASSKRSRGDSDDSQ